ncbi:MAG: DUF5662 family protein, partial [Lachnospiraceae bacterium]
GCRYYQGVASPNNLERRAKGYSLAWLHHKGRNKHHMEYWIDYGLGNDRSMVGMKMPLRYVVEMFIDRVSAAKNYQKENYTDKSPWNYYENGRKFQMMHQDTRKLLEKLLLMLAEKGEDTTYQYIKQVLLKQKSY